MQPRTLSREEEAELARSNKKVKDITHAEFNGGSRASSPSSERQATGFTTRTSFKDKLVGEIPGAFAKAFDLTDHMEEDLESDDEDGQASYPIREGQVKIKLSKDTKRRIRGPWSKAIIVKLVGRTMGLSYMQSKLSQLWRPEGRMDCIDLSYGFFLVRFYSKEDLERVIKRGPWFIGDHFLSLRPWEPFFKPSTANVSLITVWIRLNELPIELYEIEVLKEIGESIGKVLRIDSHTAMEARGRYARLCVQVDINRPLVNSMLIGRFEQVVTYEGINKLCFSCGRIGHKVEACPYTIRKEKDLQAQAEEVPVSQTDIDDDGNTELRNDGVTQSACEATNGEGHYGPWMIVSRRRNGQKGTRTGQSTGFGTAGSAAWNSANHLTLVFAEGTNMAVGGPSSSKNVSRRNAKLKTGPDVKFGDKLWASKAPGLFTHKEKATSSPSRTRLPMGDFERAVNNLKQVNNPGPSLRVPTDFPSSVKGKKSLLETILLRLLPSAPLPLV
nr:uncharacterized protein CFP56_38217 [Quercus suber]